MNRKSKTLEVNVFLNSESGQAACISAKLKAATAYT